MANYEKRENGSWSVRFRIRGINGKIVNKRLSGFPKKSLAEEAYRNFMKNYVEPKTTIIDKDNNITFLKLYSKYLAYCATEIKESSLIRFKNNCELHIIPYFKDCKINDIKELDVLTWKQIIDKKTYTKNGKQINLSPKTKKLIFSQMVHILNFAKKYYGLEKNNAIIVGNFKDKHAIKKEMSFWTLSEFDKFISVADNKLYKTVFETLFYTGMRKGELMALLWSDIDFNKNVIKISKTASRTISSDENYIITSPKSKNGNRIITMPDKLNNSLKSWYDIQKSKQLNNKENYVFGGERVLPQQNILNYLIKWCNISDVKKIRIHDLRHSHVSMLISTGGQSLSLVYVIAKRIGDTPEQIFKTYGHLFPDDEKAILNNFNKCIENKI